MRRAVILLFFLAVSASFARVALASPTVTITKPSSGAVWTGSLDVSASVSSPYAVSSVRATVESAASDLAYSTSLTSWNGNIDLASLAKGTKTLTVTATDAIGATGSASVTFKLATPPVLAITSPLPFTVARPSLGVSIVCASCATLTLSTSSGSLVASGTTSISGTYSLPINPASVTLVVKGTDGDGLVTTTDVPIYVEPSGEIEEYVSVPGEILEVDATRILWRDSSGTLKVRQIAAAVDLSTGLTGAGRLTPKGVVSGSTEWRQTGTVTWGFDTSATGAAVKGSWAGRALGNVRLRNLVTDVEKDVLPFAGASCFGLGDWIGPGGEAVLACESCLGSCSGAINTYFYDGSTTVMTSAYSGLGPPTGYLDDAATFAVINVGLGASNYAVHGPSCMAASSASVLLPSGYASADLFTVPLTAPGRALIRFNGDWTAYAVTGTGTSVNDIWRCSKSSAPTKMSIFSGVTAIETLATNGDVMLQNTVRDWTGAGKTQRHLATGTGLPRLITEHDGPQVGTSSFDGCGWKLAIGRTLFRVKGSTTTGCAPGDAGTDGGAADAGYDSGGADAADTSLDAGADSTSSDTSVPDATAPDAADVGSSDSDPTLPDTEPDALPDAAAADSAVDATDVGSSDSDPTLPDAEPDALPDAPAADATAADTAELDSSSPGTDAALDATQPEEGSSCSFGRHPNGHGPVALVALLAIRRVVRRRSRFER